MAKEEKLRSEIDDKYKWDLTTIYKNKKVVHFWTTFEPTNVCGKNIDDYEIR